MKKILSFTLCVFMLLSFTGCFESEPTKEINQDYQNTSSEKIIEEEFSLNETAVFEDLKITATEKKETIGKSFFEASEGKIFVGVKFTIENISDEEQHISSLLLFEAYADDIKCDYSFSAVSSFDGGTLDGSIAPGKKMVGWYAVEIPENWSKLEFEVQPSWLSSRSATFVINK